MLFRSFLALSAASFLCSVSAVSFAQDWQPSSAYEQPGFARPDNGFGGESPSPDDGMGGSSANTDSPDSGMHSGTGIDPSPCGGLHGDPNIDDPSYGGYGNASNGGI